jgi:hypothetical protein
VLNHHRFWGYASGPSSSSNTLPSSTHGHAARRSALPRERFSPMTQPGLSLDVRFCALGAPAAADDVPQEIFKVVEPNCHQETLILIASVPSL